jgi:hypothetical protein
MTSTPPTATPARLAPAPALDLASLRLDAGAMLFGRLDPPHVENHDPGALTRCLQVTVRLEGDHGVSRATTACPAHAHDAHDPDDPSDDRSRWWRGVVPPFHDAHPRPSPDPVAPSVARDFALHLVDAAVGERGVLTVSVSPEVTHPCVLLREPFEIARAVHEFAPRRLPSVVEACGAAHATPFASAHEPRTLISPSREIPPSHTLASVLLLAVFSVPLLLHAKRLAPPGARKHASLGYWVVLVAVHYGHEVVRYWTTVCTSFQARVKRTRDAAKYPSLPMQPPNGKIPLGAWRVKRLLREEEAGRLPRETECDEKRGDVHEDEDGFLYDDETTWTIKATVVSTPLPCDDATRRDRGLATKSASAKSSKKKRDLVSAFLFAPGGVHPSRAVGWPESAPASEWDSERSFASTDVASVARGSGARDEDSKRNPFKTPKADLPGYSPAGTEDGTEDDEKLSRRLETEPTATLDPCEESDDRFFVRLWGRSRDARRVRALLDDLARSRQLSGATLREVSGGVPNRHSETRSLLETPKGLQLPKNAKEAFHKTARRGRRRTSAAFDFREISETPSPFNFATFDGATWRRAGNRRVEE